MHLTTLLSMLALAALSIAAPTPEPSQQLHDGKVAQIIDQSSFCLLLPAQPGISIGDSEGSAVVKCTGSANTQGSQRIPDGVIKSAHVIKTPNMIQVTGRLDLINGLQVNPSGGGGQYDDASWGIEPLSACYGYDRYVEFVGDQTFCIRCCRFDGADPKSEDYDKSSGCFAGRDTAGCFELIKGDYGEGFGYKEQSDASSSSWNTDWQF
ncbi:hypothetical protein HDU96_005364 [Phlyctochytrium bullatum]|nr:hypothetical protein HDU96_005364 [Phlyctochytrium bullatum]